jgi:hypothetical protein
MAQVVETLPKKCEIMSSNPSTLKTKTKKQNRQKKKKKKTSSLRKETLLNSHRIPSNMLYT